MPDYGVDGGELRKLRTFATRPYYGGFEWHYTLDLEAFAWCGECERAFRWGDSFVEVTGTEHEEGAHLIACAYADQGCDGGIMAIYLWNDPEWDHPHEGWPATPEPGGVYRAPPGANCVANARFRVPPLTEEELEEFRNRTDD
jgi:hypothetical protein